MTWGERSGTSAGDRRRLIRLLSSLLWPRGEGTLKRRVIAAVALTLAAKFAAIGAPFFYKQVIEGLSDKALVAIPIALILAYGLAQVGTEVMGALRQLAFAGVAQRAIRLTTVEVLRHVHSLSLRFHLDRQTGGVSRMIERGAFGVEMLLEVILFNIAPTFLELALVLGVLWRFYSPAFALMTLAAASAYLAFTLFATSWRSRFRREMNRRDVAASIKSTDGLLNYETVKYFTAEAMEVAHVDRLKQAYQQAAMRNQSVQALVSVGQAAIVAVGSVAVMLVAARGVAARTLTVGDFVLINAYLLQLYAPLGVLGATYGVMKQSLTDIEAMNALLAEPREIEDCAGAVELAAPSGRIVFDRVSFAYDPRRPIVEDLSFEVPAGKTVAIVGPTGGGKSTLARLLFRFYDVCCGAITIDGQDLRDVTQLSLRQAIGVVPQDTVLFNDTIYHNIAYGRPGASREEVEQAARLARLHDFILRLPEGYETQVGERGLKLSGGEKQRVAIARTILKRPRILIFDEATSALDSHTEQEIQASLREVSADRSTLVIAHRLSTIVDADLILVLGGGRILERGRHAELLGHGGVYASMWSRQRRAAKREPSLPDVAE